MAKTSIGQFIAALRKANGMTQQEVADRLNVSNKAVSRWERDECAPDLTLIPALAEMFGITCDELLKGERISDAALSERKEPKIEKQIKALINRTLVGFKTLIWISLAVAAVGLVCMFGISYSFYRPTIGFAVMLLFEACSFVLAALAVIRTRDIKTDNELFEKADETLVEKFNHTLGSYSYIAFFTVLSAVILSLPLVANLSGYTFSVLGIYSYRSYFLLIALALTLIFFRAKKPFEQWITESKSVKATTLKDKTLSKMNLTQIGLVVLATALFICSPYLSFSPSQSEALPIAANMLGLALLIMNIVIFIVFAVRNRNIRGAIIITGLRNSLFAIPALVMSEAHYTGFEIYDTLSETPKIYDRYDVWQEKYLYLSLLLVLTVIALFDIITAVKGRRHKSPWEKR